MPYSPIRLEQLDQPQISGYILDVVDTVYVSTSGIQDIYGVKTFYSGVKLHDSGGVLVLDSTNRTLGGGSWQYNFQTVGPSGIVNTSFLQTGDFNLLNVVRATGNQTINGQKTFNSNTLFGIDGLNIGDSLAGSLTTGTAIYSNGDFFIDFGDGGRMGTPDGVRLDWGTLKISGNWEAENLKTNAARINRKVINSASYTVLSSDYYLAVNSSGSAKTLIFPSASDNRIYKIKDVAGMATGNNITLSGSGITFDYQATYVISDAYASIELIAGSGSNYEVF